jgi:mannitol/fructose-specific phosphotransferase system IIA component (Ntr-type)
VSDVVVILGISKDGIDYGALDGLLCHFILLILEPINKPNEHRTLINIFQDLIKNSNIKSKILEVNSNDKIEKIIEEWEANNQEDELI